MKSRIEEEKKIVSLMIRLYCRGKEGNRELCKECEELERYALRRLSHCPFGEEKTVCRLCTIHCYSPRMQEKIRQVMRYSGPRMVFRAPRASLLHLTETLLDRFSLLRKRKRPPRPRRPNEGKGAPQKVTIV